MAKNKIEIPKLILDHLLQYGNTSILGLGTLYLDYKSAYLSEDRLQMFPPSNRLLFKDKIDNTEQFTFYVANRMGISSDKAIEKLDKYAQHIINSLLNFGKADILSVGQFTKEDGKDIKFTQIQGEVNSEFFGLTTVRLKPIEFYKDGKIEIPMAISTAEMPNRKAAATSVSPLTVSNNPPSYNYDDGDSSNWIKPLLWLVVLFLLCSMIYKGCEAYKKNQSITPIENLIDSTEIDNGQKVTDIEDRSNVGEGNPSNNDTSTVDNVATKANDSTKCVIILGAFESARNAMKMSTKISAMGYTPYEEYYDTMDLTRVGFKFDCGEKDLRVFMQEIRSEITQDAWFLVPRITVE